LPPACAGRRSVDYDSVRNDIVLKTIKYQASEGTEYFLSFESEDKKILYAFLRLRINDIPENNFIPALRNSALIRELHTYGQLTSLGDEGEVQHTGIGKKLLEQAETLTRKHRLNKIAVISGIGVRKYYQKLGYELQDEYMVKNI
jgi:histone acetyltransferase (RNA polymerase elongator complex component)